MTEMDLLKALGEIREEYTEEALGEDFAETGAGKREQKCGAGRGLRRLLAFSAAAAAAVSAAIFLPRAGASRSAAERSLRMAGEAESRVEAARGALSPEQELFSDTLPGAAADSGRAKFSERAMSPEEAEEKAGFRLRLPEERMGYEYLFVRAAEKDLLELGCVDGGEREGYRIRKERGTMEGAEEDACPGEARSVETAERSVRLCGDGGEISAAYWTENGFRYSLIFEELRPDEAEALRLVRGIK